MRQRSAGARSSICQTACHDDHREQPATVDAFQKAEELPKAVNFGICISTARGIAATARRNEKGALSVLNVLPPSGPVPEESSDDLQVAPQGSTNNSERPLEWPTCRRYPQQI